MEIELNTGQLFSFFTISPEIMAILNREGHFLEVNPAWEKKLGFTVAELKNIPFIELVHEKDISQSQIEIQKLLQGQNTVSFETQCQGKDRQYHWVRWNWFRTGEEDRFCLVGLDITELKETHNALQESREKFKRLIESANEGIAIHEKGVILESNKALARMFGFEEAEEMVGKNGLDLTAPEYKQLIINHILAGYDLPYEVVGIRKDGSRFDCLLSGKPILYQGRQVRVSTFLDITPLKKREQELFESQELFRKLAEASKDGIAVSEKGKILIANPSLAKMFGYTLAEMIGRNAVEFTAPQFRETLLKKVLEEEEKPYEVMGLRKDGSRFPVEITPRMTSYQGRRVRVAFFRDITQRKKIEEEVQRQKEFSQNLINSSIDGFLAYDMEFRYTLWNPAMERISGHSREEVIGQCAFDVFPFLKQIGEDKFFQEALQGKTGFSQERPYRTPAGRQGFFEARYMPIKTALGQIIGGLGIIHEVTERKKTEEALRVSEMNLKAVFNNTFQNIILMDREGRILTFNPNAAAAIKENTGKDLKIGKFIFEFTHVENMEFLKMNLKKALQGEAVQLEKVYKMGDGLDHWFELNYYPVFDERGEIEGLCLTSLDIDERKKVEDALQRSEADLRSIFNSGPQSIILAGSDGTIRDFNANAKRDLKDTRGQELEIGGNLSYYVEPEFQKAYLERFKKALGGETVRIERTVQGVDQKAHWFEFIYHPVFDNAGKGMGVCLTISCIDERKNAEEALLQSENNLKAIFKSVTQSVALLNIQGEVQAFNKKASDDFQKAVGKGLSPGTLFESYIRPEDRLFFLEHFEKAKRGVRVSLERAYRVEDGSEHWFEYSYNPVLSERGDIVGVCFVSSMIDDRKKSQKAIEESEERFRKIFEDASMAMAMVNDFKFLKVNRAFQELLGYLDKEIEGKTLFEITHPEDLHKTKEIATSVHDGATDRFQSEKRYLRKDGQSLWANVSGTVIRDGAGKKLYSLIMIENITDRKKAQEALRRSEADLKAVFDSGSQVTILINRDGRIQGFNKSASIMAPRILGRNIETGMFFAETLPPGASLTLFQESFAAALEGKETKGERPIIAAGGKERWVEVNYQPVFNDEGGVDGVCFSLTFIDERKKTERDLLESQERFRRLAQVTQEGILIHENPKVVDVNPALAEMLGYTREEMIGKSGFDFLAPESHEAALHHMREGSAAPYEAMALRKNGSLLPVELQGRNFSDKGKELRVLSVRDLTWRKEAERVLTESENRYRRLVELSPEAVIVHAGGKVLYVNPSGVEMFGASGEKVEGRSVLEFLHPETREMAMARVHEIMETGEATNWVEQKLVRFNGEEFPAETKGTPFLYQGTPSVLTIVRDITERKKTQQTLLRYERLAAVGKVIAAIAHEIRNPLAVVSGMSQVLKEKFEGRSEFSEEVGTILTQTERLRLFMNDILDYSRELSIKKTEVDPKALMEKSLRLVQNQLDPLQASIHVERNWDKDLPFLWADGERVEQILVNLILNAFQSMGRKGTLILSGRVENNQMFLGIQDNGQGINEADFHRLFEPFFTTKKHGSGLGLPISEKIAEAHGGKIEVQGIRPHGTLFTLQLPIQKK